MAFRGPHECGTWKDDMALIVRSSKVLPEERTLCGLCQDGVLFDFVQLDSNV